MEIELLIQKKKKYSSHMEFINIGWLIKDSEKHENFKGQEEIFSTLKLLTIIADSHH